MDFLDLKLNIFSVSGFKKTSCLTVGIYCTNINGITCINITIIHFITHMSSRRARALTPVLCVCVTVPGIPGRYSVCETVCYNICVARDLDLTWRRCPVHDDPVKVVSAVASIVSR